jgi:beta-1,2-mannobiose phosphorylase / 1,2-beta-oligomannan phosphorylase
MQLALASGFIIERLGVVMRPDPTRAEEIEGVLNPAAVRGPDGELYLFPRLVGANNYSRIGIARVLFGDDGVPTGVERLGIALEPEEPYELRPGEGTGGCEDPRVTFVEPIGLYVMTYVALGPHGPRVALAISENCLDWERLGLVDFQPDVSAHYGKPFNNYDNKDAAFLSDAVQFTDGRAALGMFHRPLYDAGNAPRGIDHAVPAIWISGCDLDAVKHDVRHLRVMNRHALVAQPSAPWESLRVGVGTPPVLTSLGYMIVYHGVNGELARAPGERNYVTYDAGVLIFRPEQGRLLRYRSTTPVLIPENQDERDDNRNVVFPTGIDKRAEDVFDVYYGMADRYIGVARLRLPKTVRYEETPTMLTSRVATRQD